MSNLFFPVFCLMIVEAEYLKTLGLKIKKVREENEISQQNLATDCNVAKSTIQRIEKGKMNPTIIMLEKICEVLGVPVSQIIP